MQKKNNQKRIQTQNATRAEEKERVRVSKQGTLIMAIIVKQNHIMCGVTNSILYVFAGVHG